jgi:hypothetical protein
MRSGRRDYITADASRPVLYCRFNHLIAPALAVESCGKALMAVVEKRDLERAYNHDRDISRRSCGRVSTQAAQDPGGGETNPE